jgi:hypothetical protein
MSWQEMLLSPAAIALYASVVLFVYRKLQIKYKWETERWEGMITAAFLVVEKSGLKTGSEKLDAGIKEFMKQYQTTYGKAPSVLDLKDAALDFARMAMAAKKV